MRSVIFFVVRETSHKFEAYFTGTALNVSEWRGWLHTTGGASEETLCWCPILAIEPPAREGEKERQKGWVTLLMLQSKTWTWKKGVFSQDRYQSGRTRCYTRTCQSFDYFYLRKVWISVIGVVAFTTSRRPQPLKNSEAIQLVLWVFRSWTSSALWIHESWNASCTLFISCVLAFFVCFFCLCPSHFTKAQRVCQAGEVATWCGSVTWSALTHSCCLAVSLQLSPVLVCVCVCVRLCARDSQASSTGVCTLIELKSKGRKNTWILILPPSLEVKSRKKEKKSSFWLFLARNHLCTLLSHSRSGVDVLTRQSMTELYLISVFVFV